MACTFKVVETRDEMLRAAVVRSIVFVGEQRCPIREEFDGLDAGAIHVLGEEEGEPIAAGRIRAVDGWAKLERIAVLAHARGRGLGHDLVEHMLRVARERGFRNFKMHAQAHLVDFYRRHGFEPRGEVFQEAGIDHYLMLREEPGADTLESGVPPVLGPTVKPGLAPAEPPVQAEMAYAGFWARVGAAILDSLLVLTITLPLLVAHYGTAYFSTDWSAGWLDFLLSYVFPAIATVLFWTWKSATPGKMVIHARIVDARTLRRPTPGQCIGRYLAYLISGLPLGLGFLWVAWDARKQGWHDKLAGTVVLRREHKPRPVTATELAGAARDRDRTDRERDEDWLPF